jgi:hypothetical protein
MEQRFYEAFALSYAPSIAYICVHLVVTRQAPSVHEKRIALIAALTAPLLLAFAAAACPQIDLIVVKATQPAEVFQTFARASLFYKAVFFLFLIGANWLLPYEIRGTAPRFIRLESGFFLIAGVVVSAALALTGPFVSSWVMHWSEAPPMRLIFLSCWNMCLLSWIFLLIQKACAQDRVRPAALLLAGVSVVYGAVWLVAPSITLYFTITIAAAAGMILIYVKGGRA